MVGKKPINQQIIKRNIIMKLFRRKSKSDIINAYRQLKSSFYRVRQNYGNQSLMERYKLDSLSAINLTGG